MSKSIRARAAHALITVGMLPFSSSPGQPSLGFDPPALKNDLDLICVHVYPKPPPFEQAMSILEHFDCGKPLVIEETFPMECQASDMPAFIEATKKKHVVGWIGFYWGQTPAELAASKKLGDVVMLGWLKAFEEAHP